MASPVDVGRGTKLAQPTLRSFFKAPGVSSGSRATVATPGAKRKAKAIRKGVGDMDSDEQVAAQAMAVERPALFSPCAVDIAVGFSLIPCSQEDPFAVRGTRRLFGQHGPPNW